MSDGQLLTNRAVSFNGSRSHHDGNKGNDDKQVVNLPIAPWPKSKSFGNMPAKDELPPDSILQAQFEVVRILQIDVPLSAKRQFELFCSEHFPGLADILDCLVGDQLWALLSMRVQLADSDQPHAQSAALALETAQHGIRRIRST